MTRAERGWLAGIIDGEGSIFARMKCRKATLTISIANNHPRILERCRSLIEELTGMAPRVVQPGDAHCRYIQCSGVEDVRKILQCVLPHLVGKRDQAIVALGFLEGGLSRYNKRATDEESAQHRKVCDVLRKLNARYNHSIEAKMPALSMLPVETVGEGSEVDVGT